MVFRFIKIWSELATGTEFLSENQAKRILFIYAEHLVKKGEEVISSYPQLSGFTDNI